MAPRFLILVFAALPAVVQAQSVDFADWEWLYGPPAFVQPVAVGEVLTGLRLGICQYGILKVTPATDGMLQVRVTWDQAGGPFGVYFAQKRFYGDTGVLITTHVVAAGRTTEIAVDFESGWWECYGGGPWPFTVEISMVTPSALCAYAVSRTSILIPPMGGQGSVDVGTSNPGCLWSPTIEGDWLVLLDTGGEGPGVVTFEAGANRSTQSRYATLTIEDQSIYVVQDGDGTVDADGDGLPTSWETQFGLDPGNASGLDGASGDPDHDGRSNRDELLAGTHPRGLFTRYFAEGVTSDFFDLRLAFLNPNSSVARALVLFRTTGGTTESHVLEVPSGTVRVLNPKVLPRMNRREFSTIVESDQPLVADRTITWNAAGYGSHTETSVAQPAMRWYFAEGSTAAGFNLFYLLQNPNASEARVMVRYLRPTAAPLEKTYDLPPNSRSNIWVNDEDFPGLAKALASSDVSAAIEVINGPPIVVERAMYRDTSGQVFGAGHESAGVVASATEWFLAEGATGPFFDLYVLVANPSDAAAQVEATYLLPDGTGVKKPYTIAAGSRSNIHVDLEDAILANTAVSTTVRSVNDVPIVVERAMWWPDGGWYEGHSSPGATSTGTAWAFAEGEVGGARGVDTYILVANISETTGTVKVTLLFEDGTSIDRVFAVTARSRFNVNVREEFPAAVNKRFGALIESQGPTPVQLVVERSMYWNATGQFWAAGTNAHATRLQ
jgi:hypothetical protein